MHTAAAGVLAVPLSIRLLWGWRTMVRDAAKLIGVKPESHLRLIPVVALVASLALAAGAAIASWNLWRGRIEARDEAAAENRRLTAATIAENRAVVVQAIGELQQTTRDMEARLLGKVEAIDDKVNGMQSVLGATQADYRELKARLEAANEDKGRLWQILETEKLKQERMDRELVALRSRIERPD